MLDLDALLLGRIQDHRLERQGGIVREELRVGGERAVVDRLREPLGMGP
jgi:hypothetical protein